MNASDTKMVVEIWSDTMCAFCYIGKRRFERALEQFPGRDNVEVVWRSYQLMPFLETDTEVDIYQFLSKEKGFDLRTSKQIIDQITQMGKQDGLAFDFDNSVPANTFNAHRFKYFAKDHGKENEAQEELFRAYFTDGLNVDDYSTLIALGEKIGLDRTTLSTALENGAYADRVRADISEAHRLNIRSVPFFVYDGVHAISGAQEPAIFAKTLQKAFEQRKGKNPEVLK